MGETVGDLVGLSDGNFVGVCTGVCVGVCDVEEDDECSLDVLGLDVGLNVFICEKSTVKFPQERP